MYLLEGRDGSIIISGGMSYLVPDLLHQFDEFGLREDRIQGIVILHAHFDHIGIVPFFHRRNPGLKIYASARAWEILSEPKHIDTINKFSHQLTERMRIQVPYTTDELDWPVGLSGAIVSEVDAIDLGNREIRIFETPGHSSCSISAYVPQIRRFSPRMAGESPTRGPYLPQRIPILPYTWRV